MIKSLSPYDKFFVSYNGHIQLAMRCTSESYTKSVVENIKKIAIGTQLRLEKDKVIYEEHDFPVYRLPDTITTAKEATNYMVQNLTSKKEESLATIAANKRIVGINSHHLCFDGGMGLEIFNALRDGINNFEKPKKLENVFDLFPNEIQRAKYWPLIDVNNPSLTRIKPKDKIGLFETKVVASTYAHSNVNDFKCYNKKTGKVHMLTDSLYAQMILTAAAFEGKFSKSGVKTMINMRPYMKKQKTWENCAVLSKITVNAENATLDTKVGELMNMLRFDFNKSLSQGKHFGYLKKYEDKPDLKKVIPGTFFVLTNVGQFRLGGPFDDVNLSSSGDASRFFSAISLLHFAKINDKKNEAHSRLSYQSSCMSKREADLLLNSIHYGLENIGLDKSIAEAIEMIKEFQKNFIKTKYDCYLI